MARNRRSALQAAEKLVARGRLEAATYVSLTEHAGRRVLWYPDRKSFLLGKLITDEMLDAMEVPQ